MEPDNGNHNKGLTTGNNNGIPTWRKAFNGLKVVLSWLLAFLMLGAYVYFLIRVYKPENSELYEFYRAHFKFFIGLPAAGVFAFLLVSLLEQQKGPIKIKVGILNVEGAGSALLFWIVIFWTIVLSISLLW